MALTKVTGHVVKPDTNIQFHNTKSTGIVTFAHTSNATSSTTGALQITGGVGIVKDLHVGGNVTVGGTLTYDDVTNIDSIGIITARDGIFLPNDKQVKLGNTAASPDFKIYHNTVANTTSPPNHLYANSNYIDSHGAGNLFIRTAGSVGTYIGNTDGEHAASFHANGSAVLYHDASERFRTVTGGISVTGSIASSGGLTVTSGNIRTNDGGVSIFGAGGAVLYLNDSDDNPDYQLQNIGGAFAIKDSTNNAERLSITSAGNIGIGSAIPSQLLDVAGTIKTANITSDSSNLSIENTADRVMIKSANRIDLADNTVRFQNRAQNETLLHAVAGASGYVKLYHNNSLTASVTQDALTVTGRTSNSGMIEIASNQGANNNDRFRLHKTSAAQRLSIQNYASGSWVENIRITAGGLVELKHADGTTKMHTDTTGITVANRITGSGDSNTYINVGPNDIIDLYTGGSNVVRMNANGNLLVSKTTTSDHGKFEVKGGTADDIETADITAKTIATFSGSTPGTTAAGKGAGIVIKPIADRGCNYFIGVANDSSNQEAHGRFIIRSGNFAGTTSERLRIKSDGKVLIPNTLGLGGATSSPSGLLHAQTASGEAVVKILGATNGVIQLSGYNGDSTINFGDASSDSPGQLNYDHGTDTLAIKTGGGERLRIASTGELGLGLTQDPPTGTFTMRLTETPEFNIYSTQHAQNNNIKINFGVGQSASVDGNTGGRIEMNIPNAGGQMTGELKFHTNSGDNLQERLRIRSSGEVTLGQVDTSSSSALHIRSITGAETTLELSTKDNYNGSLPSAKISFTQQNGTEIARVKCDTNTGAANMADLTFWTNYGGLYERMRISKTGDVKFATSNSTTDYLQYGNNPRLWLRCPSNMNGLRIDASTTPLEVRSSDANQRSISIGGSPNFDLSLSGDYSLSSSSQRDNSPTIFLNTTRWNGSSTVTSFQTSIQAVTTSNSNNIGYLGFGASASPQNITIHTSGHICLNDNDTSDLTDVCRVRIASTFKNTVRNGSGRCVERGWYSMNTGSGSVDYFHMKTDMATNSGSMFLFTLRGYAYGSGKVMFAQTCGYCYSATNTIINDQNKSWDGDTILSTYKSSDGYVVVRAQMSSWSSYYSGFHIDVSYQNPATGTMKYKVTASAINNTSDHYA